MKVQEVILKAVAGRPVTPARASGQLSSGSERPGDNHWPDASHRGSGDASG